MKKKKIIIAILIALFLVAPVVNVNAAKDCSKYTTKKKCKAQKGCKWVKEAKYCKAKKEKDTTKSNVLTDVKDVKFCSSTAKIWKVVGKILMILKIVVPLALIIMGTIDFSKAVLSGSDQLPKSLKSLMIRVIAGILIFFIPTIVTIIMGLVVSFSSSGVKADYEICRKCILSPRSCDTSNDASK